MSEVIAIDVFTEDPRIVVQGFVIRTAPPIVSMYRTLGEPSRIDTGETPAPYGHRNNHIHVYDSLGLRFNEHHYTRLVQEVALSFDPSEPLYRFSARTPFGGRVMIDGVAMPLGGPETTFIQASPVQFEPWLSGLWHYRFAGFALHVTARGAKLPSGKRSKSRHVIDLSFSFPHDDWAKPDVIG